MLTQLRHLRGQSKQLASQLHEMQRDMMYEEHDLNVLHTQLQQLRLEDSHYVRLSLAAVDLLNIFTVFILCFILMLNCFVCQTTILCYILYVT